MEIKNGKESSPKDSVIVKVEGTTNLRLKGTTLLGRKLDVKNGNLSLLISEIKRLTNDRYSNVYNNNNLAQARQESA